MMYFRIFECWHLFALKTLEFVISKALHIYKIICIDI